MVLTEASGGRGQSLESWATRTNPVVLPEFVPSSFSHQSGMPLYRLFRTTMSGEKIFEGIFGELFFFCNHYNIH